MTSGSTPCTRPMQAHTLRWCDDCGEIIESGEEYVRIHGGGKARADWLEAHVRCVQPERAGAGWRCNGLAKWFEDPKPCAWCEGDGSVCACNAPDEPTGSR